MSFSSYNQSRVTSVNGQEFGTGDYVLYWMQAYRRLDYNHALNYAIELSKKYKKDLIVYEGVRMDYPHSSMRLHKFLLEGILDNYHLAKKLNIEYWYFIETKEQSGVGILRSISENAYCIVTDEYPAFIIPNQTKQLSTKIEKPIFAVDANGIIPLVLYEKFHTQARFLRSKMHKLFAESFVHLSRLCPKQKINQKKYKPPYSFLPLSHASLNDILSQIQFQNLVLPEVNTVGGTVEARRLLKIFVQSKLNLYKIRSIPTSVDKGYTSILSPYIHFGHISVDEILLELLNQSVSEIWTPDRLNFESKDSFFSTDENLNTFLDQLITWRDVGFALFKYCKQISLDILPNWTKLNFQLHRLDKREYIYTKDEFEYSKTHDPLWNLAMDQLRETGRMHNYLRMLWGKKIIEWSRTYEEAFLILEELNNQYAYDGRDPNSYTGILWCFGLFDRPFYPERNVLGTVRYMSSESTIRKFGLKKTFNLLKN